MIDSLNKISFLKYRRPIFNSKLKITILVPIFRPQQIVMVEYSFFQQKPDLLNSMNKSSIRPPTEVSQTQQNQTTQSFVHLLGQKHIKQFHLVDDPSIAYQLSKKTVSQIPLTFLFQKKSENVPKFGSKSLHKKPTHDPERGLYQGLQEKMKQMLRQMYQCFSKKKLNVSEIFEYEQVILKGFLKSFVDDQKKICKEKGQFIQFIWEQTIHLLNAVLTVYQQKNNLEERYNVSESLETHQTYQHYLEESEKKRRIMGKEIKKLHQMIEFLVRKMRMRKKEAKKLFKESQHLFSMVNDLKDKNIDLEIKYIDRMIHNDELAQKQVEQLEKKKKNLIEVKNKILLPQNSEKRRRDIIEHEMNLEGQIDVSKFISQMKEQMDRKENTNLEVEAGMENLIEQLENNFEEGRYAMRTKPKLLQNRMMFIQTRDKATITDFLHKSIQTQITYTDKLMNDLISSVAVNTDHNSYFKKKRFIDQHTQFDKYEAMKTRHLRMEIIRVVVFAHKPVTHDTRQSELSIFDQGLREKFRKSSLFIRYDPNKNKKSKNVDFKNVGTQTEIQNENSSSSSSESSKFLKPLIIKQNGLKKRSRFFSKDQIHIFSNSSQKKENISRRFSTLHPAKTRSKISKRGSQLRNISETTQEKSLPIQKKPPKRNPNNLKKKGGKRSSIFEKDDQFGGRVSKNNLSESQEMVRPYTSLSMKNKVEMSSKIQDILTPKAKQIEKKLISYEENDQFSEVQFKIEDIEQLLNSFLDISEESQNQQFEPFNQKFQKKERKSKVDDIFDSLPLNDKSEMTGSARDRYFREDRQLSKTDMKRFAKTKKETKKGRKQSGLVEKAITKMIKKKSLTYGNLNTLSIIDRTSKQQMSLQPVVDDVRKKIRDSTFQTKKLIVPIKHKNLYNVISSIFTKSLEMIRNKEGFKNFMVPLYETTVVIYGALPKSDIYKKIINFLAQMYCFRENSLFKSVLFFLNLDDDDPNSVKITTFDIVLFLNLIIELSATASPISDLETAKTNLYKVEEVTPRVLDRKNISCSVQKEVIARLYDKLRLDMNKITESEKKKTILNLFSCAKMLISEIISIKQALRINCEALLRIMKPCSIQKNNMSEPEQKSQKISCKQLRILVESFSQSKVDEVINLRRVLGYKDPQQQINSDQLATSLLQLRILNFDQFYTKTLIKFQINSFQALEELEQKASLCLHKPLIRSLTEQILNTHQENQGLYRQFRALLLMHQIQKASQNVLQNMIGKQMSMIFSLSLMVLPNKKNPQTILR